MSLVIVAWLPVDQKDTTMNESIDSNGNQTKNSIAQTIDCIEYDIVCTSWRMLDDTGTISKVGIE